MAISLDGFAVALPVGLDEVEEMGTGVFRRDAFMLYPLKILAGEVGHVPFTGQLAGLASRGLVKAAALQYAPRCLLRWRRLGLHEKRAAVEYQPGRLELVIERLLFAVWGTPRLINKDKRILEPAPELPIVLLPNAGAELLLQPAIAESNGLLPGRLHDEQAVAHPHIYVEHQRAFPVDFQYVLAELLGNFDVTAPQAVLFGFPEIPPQAVLVRNVDIDARHLSFFGCPLT